MLFAELAVVRWTGSELPQLSFFKNLVLIAAFLGAGLGMALGARRPGLRWVGPPLLLVLAGTVSLAHSSGIGGVLRLGDLDEFNWGLRAATDVWQSLPFLGAMVLLFVLVACLFLGFGAAVGHAMVALEPLPAYLWNLGGSLVGALGMAAVSWQEMSPWAWFAVLAVPLVWCAPSGRLRIPFLVAAAAVPLAVLLGSTPGVWSPYSRITLTDEVLLSDQGAPLLHVPMLQVDGAYFMRALDLRAPDQRVVLVRYATAHYAIPYRLTQPRTVLVLGAGMGNDVAAALRYGAVRVDAVEIDPVIADYGRRLHPEHPFDSPRVRLIVDDARSFLTRCRDRYDLITLGLLDSHTLLANLPGVRLDNYLYTVESLRSMRDRLTPDGVVALSFAVPTVRPWLALKLDRLASAAFGEPPLAFAPMYDGSFLFLSGPGTHSAEVQARALSPALAPYRVEHAALQQTVDNAGGSTVAVPTDDWPHLYLRQRGVSPAHLAVFLVLALVALFAAGSLTRNTGAFDLHFLLLGAGFLLVETKGIADLGLLFGGTWLTVTAAISAVLFMSLISAWLVLRLRPRSRRPAYIGLGASLLLLVAVRPAVLLVLPLGWAQLCGALLVAAPVLFSGIVFSVSFAEHDNPPLALGSNLLGCVLGGFLEYASLSYGIRALGVIALALYALSALALVRRPAAGAS